MRFIPLFIAIQLVSLVLTVIGIPLCALLAYDNFSTEDRAKPDMFHWPWWAWPWDNKEDGTAPLWYRTANPTWSFARAEFRWTALRNPCNNLRYVWGVSKVGRPLWRAEWTMLTPVTTWKRLPLWGKFYISYPVDSKLVLKPYYAQAGWNRSGFPVLSSGIDIHAGVA